jgi:hypothetical protein
MAENKKYYHWTIRWSTIDQSSNGEKKNLKSAHQNLKIKKAYTRRSISHGKFGEENLWTQLRDFKFKEEN